MIHMGNPISRNDSKCFNIRWPKTYAATRHELLYNAPFSIPGKIIYFTRDGQQQSGKGHQLADGTFSVVINNQTVMVSPEHVRR